MLAKVTYSYFSCYSEERNPRFECRHNQKKQKQNVLIARINGKKTPEEFKLRKEV